MVDSSRVDWTYLPLCGQQRNKCVCWCEYESLVLSEYDGMTFNNKIQTTGAPPVITTSQQTNNGMLKWVNALVIISIVVAGVRVNVCFVFHFMNVYLDFNLRSEFRTSGTNSGALLLGWSNNKEGQPKVLTNPPSVGLYSCLAKHFLISRFGIFLLLLLCLVHHLNVLLFLLLLWFGYYLYA